MPGMDGIKTTKYLRDLGYTSPVVALTANAVAGQAEIFLQNGFDDFISKPIDIRQLNVVLNKFVRDKQPPEVIEAARQQKNGAKQEDDNTLTPQMSSTQILATEIAGLNIEKGLKRYGGNENTYLKVLRSYAASIRSVIDSMETVSEDTLIDYKIKIHGIKGTSLDIFSDHIGKHAAQLEAAADAGDIGFINNHNPAFLEAARKLTSDLEAMLHDIDARNPKSKRDKPDDELLSSLLAACEGYDIDGVDETMAEIDKYQYESDDGLVDWLREKVDMMSYTQIVEKLSNLRL